jgi:predicted nucleic acid-binding protein
MKDMYFVALTIEMDGILWTGDVKLKKGLTKKGFDKLLTTLK